MLLACRIVYRLIIGVILIVLCAVALPVIAADGAQGIAGGALLGEAEKLLELGQAQALMFPERAATETTAWPSTGGKL